MNKIIQEQLANIKDIEIEIDGKPSTSICDDFNEIIFKKNDNIKKEIKVVFQDYFIKPFDGFDFHEKFNNNVAPPSKIMYGKIITETEKMYMFDLHNENNNEIWSGWCPKKSCAVIL